MTTRQWGYERADCNGDHALSLFLDDIGHVMDHYAQQADEQLETRLFRAQATANKLLQAYEKNARHTTAFAGQFIEVKSVVDQHDVLQFVPIFSSGLKQQLVRLLRRSNATPRH